MWAGRKLERGARIVVAMSGGVDSSAAAALLKHQGYEIIGVTLQLYDHGAAIARKGACCAGQDIYDARRVAQRLEIPHYVLDYESAFHREVISEFAESYVAGETPIPCVRCNQRVKFGHLLETAKKLGAAALATGHYARILRGERGPELHQGADRTRDQSYFLFATTVDQLGFLIFPLGDRTKSEARALAAEFDLPVASKPDSQDICFVPNGGYARVIERLRPGAGEPGEIVHVDGRVLGHHPGIIHFTIGQRRGLGVADAEPLYVIRLDAAHRQVLVGPQAALACGGAFLREVNWLADSAPSAGGELVEVKLRSASASVPATVFPQGDVRFAAPQNGVAPGQACVFYRGSRVLGGGFIGSSVAVGA